MNDDIIPAVRCARGLATLVDAGRRPVWPIGESDQDFFEQFTRAQGARIEWVEAPIEVGVVCVGVSEVVALGTTDWVIDCARLYAHLTGRALRNAQTIEQVFCGNPAVLILAAEDVTSRLLSAVARGPEATIGLVFGRDATDLRRQVLLRSAARRLHHEASLDWVDISPLAKHGTHSGKRTLHIGSESEFADALSALRTRVPFLSFTSHSDGLDAFLGVPRNIKRRAYVFCPLSAGDGQAAHEGRQPECLQSGHCPRSHVPISVGFEEGWLLSASEVRASLLLWEVCWGLLDAEAPLDRRLSFGEQLRLSPSIGAIITCWDIVQPLSLVKQQVWEAVQRGASAGELVRRLNGAEENVQRGSCYCLIGDPDLVAVRSENSLSSESLPALKSRDSIRAGVNLRTIPSVTPRGILVRLATELQGQGRSLTPLVAGAADRLSGLCESDFTRPQVLVDAVTLLLARGSPISVWLNFATPAGPVRPVNCFGCGSDARRLLYSISRKGRQRQVTWCPRCRLVEDAPADSQLAFEIHDHDITLTGALGMSAARGFAAGLNVWKQVPREGVFSTWPVDETGALKRTFAWDGEWPRCIHGVTFALAFDDDFLVLSRIRKGS